MRKIRSIAFALAAVFLAGAVQTANASSKTQPAAAVRDSLVISVGSGTTDGNYDPCKGYGNEGINLFQTALLRINTQVETEPDIASSYTISDDRLVYTFTIRNDVKFSDGATLTPEDVVFTYQTTKAGGSSVDLTMLDSVEAVGGNQVRFKLNKVFSPFIRTTALLGIVPKHAYGDNYARNPIGTGPFRVKQLDINQQLIVEPNPYYYGVKSPFRQITILSIDEQAALAAAKSGQLDVVMVNPEYAKDAVAGMHIENFKTSDNRGFNLPTIPETRNAAGAVVGNNVTSDPAVRRALNIGISRQTIIDNALNGIGTASWVRFEGLPWASEEPGLRDGQVEEAKRVLDAAGWAPGPDGVRVKNGVRCEFRITGRTDDLQRYNLAVALAANAKPLGINILAESMEWAAAQRIARNVPTCIGTGDYSYIDVFNAFSSTLAGINTVSLSNSPMYSNRTVDGYLNAMIGAKSDAEAIDFAKKAQYDGATGPNVDFPYLWLVNIDHTYFVRDGLSLGVQRIHPHGHGVPVIQNLNEWRFQ
ncbi:MAG: ABC transporter substrate-binding protein [Spirochaetaceae bacterium]|jgi:peptide/nickel transport system substrate-binding protein|nr:ABC transporter substrate-binding protein [Spirochaetaceae bacterium]